MIISNITIQDLTEIFALPTALQAHDTDVTVHKDGLELVCIDPAHVAMATVKASLDIDKTDDEDMFAIDVTRLNEALNKFSKTDTAEVVIGNGTATIRTGKAKRVLRLCAPSEAKPPRIPEVALDVSATVPLAEIRKAVKFGSDITDHFALMTTDGVLVMSSESDDGASAAYDLGSCGEDVRVMIQSDYLSNIIKALPTTENITLEMSTDYPMRIRAKNRMIEVMTLIAPRIEKE